MSDDVRGHPAGPGGTPLEAPKIQDAHRALALAAAHLTGSIRSKMLPLNTTILSNRLRLRRFLKSDIPFVFSASRYTGFCDGMRWNPRQSENELLEPFVLNEQAWHSGTGYTFTIENRSTAEPLGRIVIRWKQGSVWELGFWTHPLHQRQGYMSEAAVALIDLGFSQLEASEIQAAHATWNVASRKVLEKAGLHFIRHVPEGFKKNGAWIEEDLLSITRQQWQHRTEQSHPVIGAPHRD